MENIIPPNMQAFFRLRFLKPEKTTPLNISSSHTAGIMQIEITLYINGDLYAVDKSVETTF